MTWHCVAGRALPHRVLVESWWTHLSAGCLRKGVSPGVLRWSIAGIHTVNFVRSLGILLQFILLILHKVSLHMWCLLLLARVGSLILLPLLLMIHHATQLAIAVAGARHAFFSAFVHYHL